jgi:hypothetical protein
VVMPAMAPVSALQHMTGPDDDIARHVVGCHFTQETRVPNMLDLLDGVVGNRPISVYRLGEMHIQSCGQSVSAPRGKAGARLNAHTELRAKRQRSAREAIYRTRPVFARPYQSVAVAAQHVM